LSTLADHLRRVIWRLPVDARHVLRVEARGGDPAGPRSARRGESVRNGCALRAVRPRYAEIPAREPPIRALSAIAGRYLLARLFEEGV
jgi:hypothetical protein